MPPRYGSAPPLPPIKGRSWLRPLIIVVVVLGLLASGATIYLARQVPDVKVTQPEGWQPGPADLEQTLQKELDKADETAELDYLFVNNLNANVIMVIHGPFRDAPPSTKSIEKMNAWIDESSASFYDALNSDIGGGYGVTANADSSYLNAIQLGNGDAAAGFHMEMRGGGMSVGMDGFAITKGAAVFVVYVIKPLSQSTEDEVEHLRQNITFE
jgi:hypothetical protein